MVHLARCVDRVAHRAHDRGLADDVGEGLRAVAAIEAGHRRQASTGREPSILACRPSGPRRSRPVAFRAACAPFLASRPGLLNAAAGGRDRGRHLADLQPRVPQLRHALRADLGPGPGRRAHARLRGHARAHPTSAGRGGRRRRSRCSARTAATPRCWRWRCWPSARWCGASSCSAASRFGWPVGALAAFTLATREPFLSQGSARLRGHPVPGAGGGRGGARGAPAAPRAAGARPARPGRPAAPGGLAAGGRLLALPAAGAAAARARRSSAALVVAAPLLWAISDLADHRRTRSTRSRSRGTRPRRSAGRRASRTCRR